MVARIAARVERLASVPLASGMQKVPETQDSAPAAPEEQP
jgi:hypothetical protein